MLARLIVTIPGVGRPKGSMGRVIYTQSGKMEPSRGTTLALHAYLVRWFAGGEFWVKPDEVRVGTQGR